MAATGGGVIVNVASTAAFFPSAGLAAYNVGKAALVMLTRVQTRTGDTAGAVATIDSIREYPGIEKAQALSSLAATTMRVIASTSRKA